jgi:hypothetical protein
MEKLDDTSAEADRIVTEVFRKMTIAEKWHRLGAIYRTARILHATGVQLRKPGATPSEIHQDWIAVTLGESMANLLKEATGGLQR